MSRERKINIILLILLLVTFFVWTSNNTRNPIDKALKESDREFNEIEDRNDSILSVIDSLEKVILISGNEIKKKDSIIFIRKESRHEEINVISNSSANDDWTWITDRYRQ